MDLHLIGNVAIAFFMCHLVYNFGRILMQLLLALYISIKYKQKYMEALAEVIKMVS